MAIEITPDRGSLVPGTPTIDTPDGPQPTVPDEQAYTGGTFDAGLGVRSFGPLDHKHYYDEFLRSESWPEGGGGITTMSTSDAAQLALYHLIRKMTWTSKDLRAIADGDASPHLTVHQIEKVWFDWPRWDAPDIPVHNAVITTPDEVPWEPGAQRVALLLDETENVYARGTVVRHLGEVEVPVQLIVWFAHPDMRRGFQARFERWAAAETARENWHRIVTVPEYFDRQVTLMLRSYSRPDDPVAVQANRWPFVANLTAVVEMVELVRVPGYIDEVSVGLEVDGLG